jgi:LVIVD repeat
VRRIGLIVLSLCLLLPAGGAVGQDQPHVTVGDGNAPGSFELVGHNSLEMRGMNAAIAVKGDYAYIGSRTDGQQQHPNAGVMVVDVSDPAAPEVVGQIGPPEEGNVGETSRELRIWPQQNLLIVLNLGSNCSPIIHHCDQRNNVDPPPDNYRFYDISGENAAAPKLVAEYVPTVNPHEFFLWVDPSKPKKRALIFQSTPGGNASQLLITDISGARKKKFTEMGTWTTLVPEEGEQTDMRLHSLSVNNAGTVGYVAYLQGGFFMIDTSDFAKGVKKPKIKDITPIPNRVWWEGPGAHTAIKLFKKNYAMITDEVYGEIPGLLPNHGCPWGWVRFVDIKDPTHPKVVSEYKIPANTQEFCDDPASNTPERNSGSSWSAHNPTLTKHLAILTWHSGGIQAIDITNPAVPAQAAQFSPEPEPVVVTEDPVLSSGPDKVVMWSYPIIQNGLIYVTDVRNGLYILRYKGPYEEEVAAIKFLEGNSNLGDALKFEPVKKKKKKRR